ncbi:S1C family serine protease [Actinoalloteichus hymeniacidonis]|uniref:Trypsin-like serine protease with C-terminal PDZ domain n=1 Tax=Actinoalloteichus hymeniacidonis TaxID=340345 RepID=A0AAC9HN31_9PSEU|nr:trypsin-like peptidase domain-containing protein [Actinoalloteichus hymeniacidonis]AOS61761.1 trypsin-like serine protease with C-terminal PDZ domain [Actinoalloteichus hymeniacidonis]MBB5910221.1 S1-C subfamily serine protease [Actinoalloteichus hymeniacidonis]
MDPAAAAVFARPDDVSSGFDERNRHPSAARQELPTAPPPAALAEAFGRQPGAQSGLQRPPGTPGGDPTELSKPIEPAFWSTGDTVWRDPSATAVLGPPAVASGEAAPPPDEGSLPEGTRLSAREVLFGGRVKPRSLLMLGAIALAIGLLGGVIGRITVEGGSLLRGPDVQLAEVRPGVEREPGSVAELASRVRPAVVSVQDTAGGVGSGVVIDEGGFIVTNDHVIAASAEDPESSLTIIFHEGSRAPAEIVGRDPRTDLAVLRVEVDNLTVLPMGRSADLEVGDSVIAVGNPLGYSGTVTEGIVSYLDRPVRTLASDGGEVIFDGIQTDAAINYGNSGGALVDTTGSLIGINTSMRAAPGTGEGEGGSIGLGFAIPVDEARRIAEELIRSGEIHHPDLGVNSTSVITDQISGAQVVNVRADSSAAQAGLGEGDIIIRVGDQQIYGADELAAAVRNQQIGAEVELEVVRGDEILVIPVTLQSDEDS